MSSEYYSKISQLLHDIGGKTLGKAIDHFCLQTIPDLPTFLDNKRIALFHLWKSKCCCTNQRSSGFKQVVKDKEWYAMFSRVPLSKAHSSFDGLCHCQFKSKPTFSLQSKELDLSLKCMLISNVCPGQLSNLQHRAYVNSIRKAKNYVVSHTDSTKIPEAEFIQYWNEVKHALFEIAKTISTEFFEEIEDETETLFYDTKWNRSLKEYTSVKLQDFEKERKKMYVQTEAYSEAQRILDDLGLVYITAGAGDGKSAMSLSLISNLKEKYNVYLLNLKDLSKYLKDLIFQGISLKPLCVLIDDAFGTSNAVSRHEIQNNEALKDLTAYISGGKLKVIITMRKSIWKRLEGTLNRLNLLCDENHIVDLTIGKCMISESARKLILLRYLEHCPKIEIINTKDAHLDHARDQPQDGTIQITDFEVKQIFEGGVQKRDYVEGFPLTCCKFVEQERHLRRKVDFFQTSYRSECKIEVEELHNTDIVKYSLLVYTLLKNGRFDIMDIDMSLIRKINKSLSNEKEMDEDEIKRIVRNDNYYLKRHTTSEYRFDHDIIFEAVLLDYGKQFPKEIISLNSSYRMVFELFRTKRESEDEVCLEIDGDMFPHLARRLIREMKEANIFTVGGHSAMKDDDFVPVFLNEIEEDDDARNLVKDLLVSASILSRPLLAKWLLPLENIPPQHKAFSFHAACWFGSDWLHLYMDYYRRGIEQPATQKILANALIPCAEKGHMSFTKDILSMLSKDFLQNNPKKVRKAFKTACYFGQLKVAILLHDCHKALGESIFQIDDYRKGICKAAMKGNVATVKWIAEFEDMIDDKTVIQVMKNACTFSFTKTAVFTARYFESLRPHLKRTLRQIFHVRFAEMKLPKYCNSEMNC